MSRDRATGSPTDRSGPVDGAWSDPQLRTRAYGFGLLAGGMTLVAALLAGAIAGAGVALILILGVGGAALVAAVVSVVGLCVSNAAGTVVRPFVAPSGRSTPYEPDFSRQDALAISGDVAGALASFEELIASSPDGIGVRIKAAEMYAGKGANPSRAAELYREARSLSGATAAHDLYVSNRLIDLYIGALSDNGRALVESRRVIERHPRSPAAAGARQLIARLKVSRPDR